MFDYQMPRSQQTLAEGLDEYYARNKGLQDFSDTSPQAVEFFTSHDAVHVVFGCSTDLADEAIVKISSIFGTTGGFRVLRGYSLHESREIYTTLVLTDVLYTTLISLVTVPRTLWRCWRMTKKWPWLRSEFEPYLNTTLGEIRSEFGIRIGATA
jgi:hypothetical protein